MCNFAGQYVLFVIFLMTTEVKKMVDAAIKGIQEKKGRAIKVVDMEGMEGVICSAFVVCEGGSPSQVSAIVDSVEETMRKDLGEKPVKVVGLENAIWVAMDFTDVMIHVFLPDARDFYSLESLWDDAKITEIADDNE